MRRHATLCQQPMLANQIFCERLFRNRDRHSKFKKFLAATRTGGDFVPFGWLVRLSMLKYRFALLLGAIAVSGSTVMASAASVYDGRWSVVIETEQGSCDRAFRYGLNIVNGNVTYAGNAAVDVRGWVAGNGNVHVRVSRGGSYADGRGRLSQSSGSGHWHGVGSGVCSGRWFAERR